jgi:hypothetical protein
VGHGVLAVLLVSACAVLTGARSFVAIAEYAHDPWYGRWTARPCARRLQQRGRAGAPGSVLDQDSGVVLAQVQVDAKPGSWSRSPALLAGLDLREVLITHARHLHERVGIT